MLAAKFVIRLRKYEESLQVTACREMPESESGAPEPKSAPRWSKSATFAYGFLRCSEMCFCDTELRCCMHGIKEKWYEVKEKWYEVLIGVCSWVLVESSMCALSVVNPCSFWRHGFRDQVLLSRWKSVKLKLERPTNQGDVACVPLRKSDTKLLWVYAEYSLSVIRVLWVCQIRAHFGDTVLGSRCSRVAENR